MTLRCATENGPASSQMLLQQCLIRLQVMQQVTHHGSAPAVSVISLRCDFFVIMARDQTSRDPAGRELDRGV